MKKHKNKLKLPLIKDNESTYPDEALCPWCKENKVLEPHSFAYLDCGALLMDRNEDSGGPSNDMDAYFSIGWHGAHPEDGGIGKNPNILLI